METFLAWAVIAGLAAVVIFTRERWRLLVLLAAINYLAFGQTAGWNLTGRNEPSSAPQAATGSAARKAYFTIGHGERDVTGADRLGYSTIASLLREQGIAIETLDFSQRSDVPPDASVVIVAGPKIDYLLPEVDAVKKYVAGGGSVLFLIDPVADLKRYITESGSVLFMIDPDKKTDNPELTRIAALANEWGVALGNDIVVDLSGMGEFLGTDASVPVVARYPPHPITENFTVLTAYPVARSVTPVPGVGAASSVQPLVETGERTWAETDVSQLTRIGEVSMDQSKGDRQGPITLAVAVSQPGSASRVVVMGDSDFVANYVGNIPGNVDFFLRTVKWLARQDIGTSSAAGAGSDRRLELSPLQLRAAAWLSRAAVPALITVAVLFVWRRKDQRSRVAF